MIKLRSICRIGLLLQIVFRLPVVQFLQTLTVLSQADKEEVIVIAEFASGNRLDTFKLCFLYKLRNTHCGIDVSQGNRSNTIAYSQIEQLADAQCAVMKAVVGVSIEVHKRVSSFRFQVSSCAISEICLSIYRE